MVAGVCDEIGLVEYFDDQDGQDHERVSLGQAIKAMVLNGLGFSNRRLYLVPQFFAHKPLQMLLGPGITPDDLNDDRLGRALDWLAAHDVTKQFAGLAAQARARFGVTAREVHVDTTSFAVEGAYGEADAAEVTDAEMADAEVIRITYGYSRDGRADLQQWMLALATTVEGDVPLFLRPLDGNASDKPSLLAAVMALQEQLATAPDGPVLFVADSGLYTAVNLQHLHAGGVRWITRVPETVGAAKTAVARTDVVWQAVPDTDLECWHLTREQSWGPEHWVIARSAQGLARAQRSVEERVAQDEAMWRQQLWHLSHQTFACQADAEQALSITVRTLPPWLTVTHTVTATPTYATKGRPKKDAVPTGMGYTVQPTVSLVAAAMEQEVQRRAAFVVATNADDLTDAAILATYKRQGSVERGFAFLKDPLFLASSVFLKNPRRIMALSVIMVLCLLVYRLAEHRLRTQLSFEGIDLLHLPQAPPQILGLDELREQVVQLLGTHVQKIYFLSE
jgi:transposase